MTLQFNGPLLPSFYYLYELRFQSAFNNLGCGLRSVQDVEIIHTQQIDFDTTVLGFSFVEQVCSICDVNRRLNKNKQYQNDLTADKPLAWTPRDTGLRFTSSNSSRRLQSFITSSSPTLPCSCNDFTKEGFIDLFEKRIMSHFPEITSVSFAPESSTITLIECPSEINTFQSTSIVSISALNPNEISPNEVRLLEDGFTSTYNALGGTEFCDPLVRRVDSSVFILQGVRRLSTLVDANDDGTFFHHDDDEQTQHRKLARVSASYRADVNATCRRCNSNTTLFDRRNDTARSGTSTNGRRRPIPRRSRSLRRQLQPQQQDVTPSDCFCTQQALENIRGPTQSEFGFAYADTIEEIVGEGLLENVQSVDSIQEVQEIECPSEIGTFQSSVSIALSSTNAEIPSNEIQSLETSFTSVYNDVSAASCDPLFRRLSSSSFALSSVRRILANENDHAWQHDLDTLLQEYADVEDYPITADKNSNNDGREDGRRLARVSSSYRVFVNGTCRRCDENTTLFRRRGSGRTSINNNTDDIAEDSGDQTNVRQLLFAQQQERLARDDDYLYNHQSRLLLNDDICFCAPGVTEQTEPSEEDFFFSFGQRIDALVERGDLQTISGVDAVQEVNSVQCPSDIQSFDASLFLGFRGDPDAIGSDEVNLLEQSFTSTYNGLSRGVCDPLFRRVGSTFFTLQSVRRLVFGDGDGDYDDGIRGLARVSANYRANVNATCRRCDANATLFGPSGGRRGRNSTTTTTAGGRTPVSNRRQSGRMLQLSQENQLDGFDECLCAPSLEDPREPTEADFLEEYDQMVQNIINQGLLPNIEGVASVAEFRENGCDDPLNIFQSTVFFDFSAADHNNVALSEIVALEDTFTSTYNGLGGTSFCDPLSRQLSQSSFRLQGVRRLEEESWIQNQYWESHQYHQIIHGDDIHSRNLAKVRAQYRVDVNGTCRRCDNSTTLFSPRDRSTIGSTDRSTSGSRSRGNQRPSAASQNQNRFLQQTQQEQEQEPLHQIESRRLVDGTGISSCFCSIDALQNQRAPLQSEFLLVFQIAVEALVNAGILQNIGAVNEIREVAERDCSPDVALFSSVAYVAFLGEPLVIQPNEINILEDGFLFAYNALSREGVCDPYQRRVSISNFTFHDAGRFGSRSAVGREGSVWTSYKVEVNGTCFGCDESIALFPIDDDGRGMNRRSLLLNTRFDLSASGAQEGGGIPVPVRNLVQATTFDDDCFCPVEALPFERAPSEEEFTLAYDIFAEELELQGTLQNVSAVLAVANDPLALHLALNRTISLNGSPSTQTTSTSFVVARDELSQPSFSSSPSTSPSSSSLPSTSPSSSSSPSTSQSPSTSPSLSSIPSISPSLSSIPSIFPSLSSIPSISPSFSSRPSISQNPTLTPSAQPSSFPSSVPSDIPTNEPSAIPSISALPSQVPSFLPSVSMLPSVSSSPSESPSSSSELCEQEREQVTSIVALQFESSTAIPDSVVTEQFEESYNSLRGERCSPHTSQIVVTSNSRRRLEQAQIQERQLQDIVVVRLETTWTCFFENGDDSLCSTTRYIDNVDSLLTTLETNLQRSGLDGVRPLSLVIETLSPSFEPSASQMPSVEPSVSQMPSWEPSKKPSQQPSDIPSDQPSVSQMPSWEPSMPPSDIPSNPPSISPMPSWEPSTSPSYVPSDAPSQIPSSSSFPSYVPSDVPSRIPSSQPSAASSVSPVPSGEPSTLPSFVPSDMPSRIPSSRPSTVPKSDIPSIMPSQTPSTEPSKTPSSIPSASPSFEMLCGSQEQDDQVIFDDFESNTVIGWSNVKVDRTEPAFSSFLGRYQQGDSFPVRTIQFDPLGISRIYVSFQFYEIDSWDGDGRDGNDSFHLTIVSGQTSETIDFGYFHRNSAEGFASGVSSPGGVVSWTIQGEAIAESPQGFGATQDQLHLVNLEIPPSMYVPSGGLLSISIGWSLMGLIDESVGIDNFRVVRCIDLAPSTTPSDMPTSSPSPDPCSVPPNNCYVGRSEPGCEDDTLENLVCSTDPFCCTSIWDRVCVDILCP